MTVTTGVRRLDDLLKGGMPDQSTTLVYGPPFLGKEVFARLFALAGMRVGVPAIIVVTDSTATEYRQALARMEPKLAELEKKNLLHIVDTYSKSIGATDASGNVEFVEGLVNFNAVNLAVNNAQRKVIRDHPTHRFVFDNVSTLIAYTNAQTAFRFLQVLGGRTRAAGATSLLVLGEGMHTDAEVQTIKHLTGGVIEFKRDGAVTKMRVEGAGLTEAPGWVDYKFTESTVDITGSFAVGRIR